MTKDPYRYFRLEARELIDALEQAALRLERGEHGQGTLSQALRQAHTLKGAARVVRQQELGELAHAFEDELAPFRDGTRAPPRSAVERLLALVDAMRAAMAKLDAPAAAPAADALSIGEGPRSPFAAPPEPSLDADTVRVDAARLGELLRVAFEAGVELEALERCTSGLAEARHMASTLSEQIRHGRATARSLALCESLRERVGAAEDDLAERRQALARELSRLRDGLGAMRLVPASSAFPALERALRDAAAQQGKRARLMTRGGATRLDAHALAALQAPLLHLVRNAVAHGLETPAERRAAGKSEEGTVRLEVERRGARVAIVCCDDGRGLDLARIAAAAVRAGKLAADEAVRLDVERALRLLLAGGLSTSSEVSALSGRGVGLETVATAVERLGGDVRAQAEPAGGTRIELYVPVSLASAPALRVVAAGQTVALPLGAVERIVALDPEAIARTPEGSTLSCDGARLPYAPLALLLGEDPGDPRAAVLLSARQERAAIGVDRLLGVEDVAIQPLPACCDVDTLVSGVALDDEGLPHAVLDPVDVVTRLVAGVAWSGAHKSEGPRPILVVDDSLTTRMLEQSILESAGFEVELAASGEEGLAKAAERRYSLFLVDVEMPGMNGFDFVAQTRVDPLLREIPAIIVTSVADDASRRRGLGVGASAYVVKGEFDQGRLLAIIHDLVGQP